MNPSNILIDALIKRDTWASASELSLELGVTQRQLRELKAASDGHVISGDQGYRLTTKAKPEEIRACVSRLRAHAVAENLSAMQIEKVYGALTQPSIETAPETAEHVNVEV